MAATTPLARSLLSLACCALLVAVSTADRRSNLPNCEEYLAGRDSRDAIILDQKKTKPYQSTIKIDNLDHCYRQGKKLVGELIVACDPLGPPRPSVMPVSTLSQIVECHSDGPCPSGLTVSVSQYCEPLN